MMSEVVNVSNDVDLPTFLPRLIRERVDWNVILTVIREENKRSMLKKEVLQRDFNKYSQY